MTGFNCENLLIANCEFLLCSQLLETQLYPIYREPYKPHEKQMQSINLQFCLQMTKHNNLTTQLKLVLRYWTRQQYGPKEVHGSITIWNYSVSTLSWQVKKHK